MIRYIIRKKDTGEFMRRVSCGGFIYSWVKSADDATLLTTSSSASAVAGNLCTDITKKRVSYRAHRARYADYPVEVIKVGVILIPEGTQPFIK